MPDVLNFLQTDGILFLFKILLLILIFVYILFNVIVVSRVRALNRTIYLAAAHGSSNLQFLAITSLVVSISLFILTLVIV